MTTYDMVEISIHRHSTMQANEQTNSRFLYRHIATAIVAVDQLYVIETWENVR